jgi:hypothetical protein
LLERQLEIPFPTGFVKVLEDMRVAKLLHMILWFFKASTGNQELFPRK